MGLNMGALAVVVLLAIVVRTGAEIVGCGGFVEASHALVNARGVAAAKLDYSFLSVELASVLGTAKEKTECSPNGYYFIPVEDRGTYVLRVLGPDGWTFEPPLVHVDVAEACGSEEYVNFEITGFSLTGSVKSAAGGKSCPQTDGSGPEGVAVTLKRPDGTTSATETAPGGGYSFGNLTSGVYSVSASHPSWKLDGAPREVTIEWGNAQVAEDFVVRGYDLSGSVVAEGNPILGVQVFLYSDDFEALPNASPPSVQGPSGHGKALAVGTTKEDGRFSFSGLPCGGYKLVPFYKGEHTVFDVSPSELSVTVGHGGASVEKPFTVTGFSVSGKVLNDKGEGIPGAKVVIDGADGGVTSADGRYSIDKVSSSSKYTIEVSKPHHTFPPLKSLNILPSMATLPDIVANSYNLCGIVIAPEQLPPATSAQRQVALTHGPPGVGPKTALVDTRTGRYCFSVPAGEYMVSPVVSSQEKAAGVLFTPSYKEVKLSGGPLLNVDFTPTKVTVSGSVTCISPPCGDTVIVSLTPIGTPAHAAAQTEKLQADDKNGKFSFLEVTPGKYKLSAKTPKPWCWASGGEKTIEVGAEDLQGLELNHVGFSLRIDSSHDVEGTIELLGGGSSDSIEASIKKGTQEVCLKKPGVYSLTFERACVYFGKTAFEFDTSAPKPIHLQATHFLTRGSISVNSKSVTREDELAGEIHVSSVPAGKSEAAAEKIPVLLAKKASAGDGDVVYEYAKWTAPGETLVLTPAHSSLLFYPRSRTVKVPAVTTLECPPKVPAFTGRPGVKVEGKISPPEEGVKVEVKFVSPSRTAGGEVGAVAVTALTDKNGRYSIGPLYDDADYEAVASKPGFQFRHLTPSDKWSFEGLKLGKIVVGIAPGSGAESPLPSVLLSLSGDQRYQKNAATGEGGALTFEELFPGTFYLKPLLKEYRFEPANAVIEVGSGEVKPVKFTAHRTAFSVLGTVRLLGGHVAEGVTVRAVADEVSEEAVTAANGQYRLRGLQPNTKYILHVKTDVSSRVERADPSEAVVSVANSDKEGVDFLGFERPGKCTITGVVEGDEEWRPHVMVEVSSASSPSVEKAVQVPFSRFFEVRGLSPGKYIVKLAFGRSERTHSFEADSVQVDLSEGCKPTHVGPLRFSATESREKHDAPVTPLIPIIGFVIAIYLFAKYTNVQSYANGGSAPGSSPGSFLSPGVLTRAKAREAGRVEDPSPVAARKPLVRRPRTSTY